MSLGMGLAAGGAIAGVAVGAAMTGVGAMDIDIGGVVTDALLNAKIIPIDPPGIPVVFSYNPKDMKWKRKAATRRMVKEGGKDKEQWTGSGARSLSFLGHLEGPQAYPFATQLLEMMTPSAGLLSMLSALGGFGGSTGVEKEKPNTLLFQWGPVFMQCWMKDCTVTYKRFHISGIPVRAECQISLEEIPFKLPGQNPTSGGLPGREQHTVVAGENLVGIATGTYGQPGQWRAVAEANGIDDPFAVRPGANLFMPSRAELQGRRPQ
jgi:nucleoid-associated protein YgaU